MLTLACLLSIVASIFSVPAWSQDTPNDTYIVRQEKHSKTEYEISVQSLDPLTGTATPVLSSRGNNFWLMSSTVVRGNDGLKPVLFGLTSNLTFFVLNSSGVTEITGGPQGRPTAMAEYSETEIITVSQKKMFFLVGPNGSATPYSTKPFDLPDNRDAIKHIQFIGPNRFVLTTGRHVIVGYRDSSTGELKTESSVDVQKIDIMPDPKTFPLVAKAGSPMRFGYVTDIVANAKGTWLNIALDPPGASTLYGERAFVYLEHGTMPKALPSVATEGPQSRVQLLDIDTTTGELLARERNNYVRVNSGGDRIVLKADFFEPQLPQFIRIVDVNHPRQTHDWFGLGKKRADALKSAQADSKNTAATKVETRPTEPRPIDLQKIRAELFRLDWGVLRYTGHGHFGAIDGRTVSARDIRAWQRELSFVGPVWEKSPLSKLIQFIASQPELAGPLAKLGLHAEASGEVRVSALSNEDARFALNDFIRVLATAQRLHELDHPAETLNYERANEYSACQRLALGY